MGSRKLVRDFFISKQPLFSHFLLSAQQVLSLSLSLSPALPYSGPFLVLKSVSFQLQQSSTRLRLTGANGYSSNRQFSVFNEFSKKIRGEASRYYSNPFSYRLISFIYCRLTNFISLG